MSDFQITANSKITKKILNKFLLFVICYLLSVICGCTSMAASAEEYFAIGMAFFDLGRFEEAERWLNRARQANRTMVASTYNLGRLAFERERFEEAVKHFEDILRRDPDNVLALRAAAYTRIKTGEIEIARRHYSRLLELVPESADDGYNHALVLHAMGLYTEAEEVMERYPFALMDNKEMQLLFARTQAALNKVEAIDSFANWLEVNSDAKVRYEYAKVLEYHEFYARALEEYHLALTEIAGASVDPSSVDIRFAISRVLLIADGESAEGIIELESIVNDGFDDIEAVENLMNNSLISTANRDSLQTIITNLRHAAIAAQQQEEADEADAFDEFDEFSIVNYDDDSETDSESGSD